MIVRPPHNGSLKRPLLTDSSRFFLPLMDQGGGKRKSQLSRLKGPPNNQRHVHNEGAVDGGEGEGAKMK